MERWSPVKLIKGRAARVKSVAYAGLFLIISTLFPIVTWVRLFSAIREPLRRIISRVIHAVLFFVVGTLLAMRQPAPVRKVPYILLFFMVAILMPVLIWIGLGIAIRDLLRRWRESWLVSTLVCRFDTDCPPGWVCIAGKCMPRY
ncbi:MAG: hypothetical protein Q8O16_07255 [Dehalococcoidia bacterium]|nr:hypothetical protein [Dehalococcoidia bacterium]